MPELPEVETVRRSLEPHLVGKRIEGVQLRSFPGVIGEMDPEIFSTLVTGRTFTKLRRRAKYLMLDLDGEETLLVHLRMTGSLTVVPHESDPVRFEHLSLVLNDGFDLRFADQRKFGRVLHLDTAAIEALDARLGPEPLSESFNTEVLVRALQRRTGPIKSILLNQAVVAGLGNIYVDETLFRSGIHPLRRANSLAEREIDSLRAAIQAVLHEGLHNRGTSFSSFRDGYGASGSNQTNLRVYGRADKGLPCFICGNPLVKLTVGGRGTHVCFVCQPPEPRQSDDDEGIDTDQKTGQDA